MSSARRLFLVLAACLAVQTLSAENPVRPAWGDTAPAADAFHGANIDWRRCEGQSIRVLLSGHPIQGAIMGLLGEFTDLTGVSAYVDVLPEEEFFQKLAIDFEKGRGNTDVFMTSPLYHWRYAANGWIEGLNRFLQDDRLTDPAWYAPDDFFPVLWETSAWNGETGSGLGKGRRYSIPVWWEGCALMYRKDLAERFGFTPPESWDELRRQILDIGKKADGMSGMICRGVRSWSQIHTYHLTMMASQGGRDMDPAAGKAAFNSPVGVAVGTYWVELMQKAGPQHWPRYNWYDVAAAFQAGRAFAVMDANPFAVMFEADGSPVRGKVGYLLPPSGAKGRQSSLWMWSLGINAFSKHKEAGWLFIQWASSKPFLRRAAAYGNWMTPRRSVWFDPDVKKTLTAVDDGRWYDNATRLVTTLARMRWSPGPLTATLGDLWAGAIQDAWMNKLPVKDALDRAAGEFDEALAGEGARQ